MDEKTQIDDLLDNTPEEDLELLKGALEKLGLIKDEAKKVVKCYALGKGSSKAKGSVKSYHLLVVFKCLTCGNEYHQRFFMEADKQGMYAKSTEIYEEVPCTKTRNEKVRLCGRCKEFLLGLEKEALVDRLIIALRS